MRPLALGLRAPYRLKRTIALLAQASLNLDFTRPPLDSRVTFSRASGGTSFRPVSFGPELAGLSTAWQSYGTGISLSGGQMVFTASPAGQFAMRGTPLAANKIYYIEVTVSAISGGSLSMLISGDMGILGITTPGTYRSSAKSSATDGPYLWVSSGTVTATVTVAICKEVTLDRPGDPIQLFTAPANVPRFDYDPVSRQCRGMLVEEQRTNLLTQSEFANGLTDAPARSGLLTLSSMAGYSNAIAVGHDGTTTSFAYKNFTHTSGLTYAVSIIVRMDDGNAPVFASLDVSSSGNPFAIVTASQAVIDPRTYSITLQADGNYRVTLVWPSGAGVGTYFGVVKYATNNSRTFKVTGYQLEVGAFATSYIPTSGTAATRAQDVAYIATAGWLNTSVGTMLLDFNQLLPPSQQDVSAIYFGAYPTTALTNGEDMGYTLYTANSFLTRNPTNAALSLGGAAGLSRIALAIDGTGKYAVRNGGAVSSYLGAGYNASGTPTVYSLSGTKTSTKCAQHVRRFAFWPRRMSNLDLQGLTR